VDQVYAASRQVDTLEQIFMEVAHETKEQPPKIQEPQYDLSVRDFSAIPALSCVEALMHSTAANT
jgi:hypothetical protein